MLLILCVAVLVGVDNTHADCDNSQSSSYAQASSSSSSQSTSKSQIFCGPNEQYNNCGTACPDTCDNYDSPTRVCTQPCVSGCECVRGYVRNPDGYCVLPQDCPRRCRNDQHFEWCASPCRPTCDNYKNPPQNCPDSCTPGCVCNAGLVETRQGQCVRREDCFDNPPVCPLNSHYEECGTPCPKTCDNQNDPPGGCATVCNPSCQCDRGYIKNRDRQCIRPSQCPVNAPPPPPACGPNEHFTNCGTACLDTCDNYDEPNRVCTAQCVIGCECDDGYVRNPDGYCVLPQYCPIMCGRNEHYTNCGTACPDTCDNYDEPNRVCTAQCVIGCECDDGYVRNPDGYCVLPQNCPIRCGPNEYYTTCGTACPDTCDNYDDPNRVCTQQCVEGCFCYDGYVRNRDGYCVLPRNCPLICGRNEHYESCGTACPDTCDDYDDPNKVCTLQCVEGCFCDKGYVRNPDGYCVPPRNCPIRCGRNEHYESCGTACPDTCDNYRDENRVCTAQCIEGCFCDRGYVRNPDGYCVPPRNCPITCRRNEHYNNCGTACPDTCENYDRSDRVCNKKCVSGCECDKGYVRNERRNCILPRHCPIRCPPNTHYEKCATACPATCDDYKNPQMGACAGLCRPGCACNKGYVLNSQGLCIPTDLCPKKH